MNYCSFFHIVSPPLCNASFSAVVYVQLCFFSLSQLSLLCRPLAYVTVLVMHHIVGIFNQKFALRNVCMCMCVKFAHQKVLLCIIFLQIGQIYGKLSTTVSTKQNRRTQTTAIIVVCIFAISTRIHSQTYCIF